MKDYRCIEKKIDFTDRMESVLEQVRGRAMTSLSREDTKCSPVQADGKNPFVDVFREMPEAPYVIAYAQGIVRSWMVTPVLIFPQEAIVGITRPIYPIIEHFSIGLRGVPDLQPENPEDPECVRQTEELKDRLAPLKWNHVSDEGERIFGKEQYRMIGQDCLFSAGGYQGHTVCNYNTLLDNGLDGILAQIDHYAAINSQDEDTQNFYEACRIVIRGMQAYLQAYADKAAELAAVEEDPRQRQYYEQIAANCTSVIHKKPETLYQAVQLMWTLVLWDWCDCVGRVDQYLYPYYEKAVCEGDVIPAEESIASIMFKIWENGSHNVTISGVKPDGTDATNDLTYLLLQILRRIHDVHPRVSLRVHENTPTELLDLATKIWAEGMSDPSVVSDKNVIEGLLEIGVPLEDARDYTMLGCQEIEIPGKSNWGCEDGTFNIAKIVEYAMYNGRSTTDPNVQMGPQTGEFVDFETFDDFYNAYIRQLEYFIPGYLYLCDRGQEIRGACFAKLVKTPFTDGCLEKGIPHDKGGPLYNYGVIETAGVAVAADSMTAIKKLVFEEKKISKETLMAALQANFQGYERERQLLLNAAPKFGNDNEEADAMAVKMLDHFWSEIGKYKSIRGDQYVGACSLLEGGTSRGERMGAMPDGRFAGESLGNTIGPRPGADKSGVTAMLASVAKLPLKKGVGGTTLNVVLTTKLLSNDGLRRNIAATIKAYLMNGGQMAQITTANLEDLLDAKVHPERHGNLIVRVGGFSRQFVQFGETTQDEIISRYTE